MSLWKKVLPLALVAVLFAVSAVPSFAVKPEDRLSIVDVAIAANAPGGPFEGTFDTLIAAILAADPAVLATLDGNGQFTVFAPTDDAFAAIGLDASNIGTELPQDTLTQILLYHVARGNRESGEVLESDQIRMLSGDFTYISLQDGMPYINQAQIIVPDVTQPDNGVIHAINAVLLP
jgi:uncharacterized surface protein with fasciclin (FAS1) repeats